MIDGVVVKELRVFKDTPDIDQPGIEPGSFLEILRQSDGLMTKFAQSNLSIAHKGTIKAFHSHKYQDDLWFIASGLAKVVLYDARKDSPTFGQTEVITSGTDNYKLVLIPVGVEHGYKVVSDEPCLLFYHVTREYDRDHPDEDRTNPYDKTIGYNWESI